MILSVIASAFNYFAYPILSRILPTHEYGDITVALSLFTQIGTFLSSLTAISIGLAKSHSDKDGGEVTSLQNTLVQVFAAISILFLTNAPFLMPLFSVPVTYAFPIVIMLLVSIPITIITGYLNGKQQLVKVGIATCLVATIQIIAAIAVSIATHSGLATMFAMGLVQIISLLLLLWLYRADNLPRLDKTLFTLQPLSHQAQVLLRFTLFSSLAVMSINLLQLVDLTLVRQHGTGPDVLFYTDTYVISRALFFAGMIFIWPFLSDLSLTSKQTNTRLFLRLIAVITGLVIAASIGIALFGNQIFHALFGRVSVNLTTSPIVYLSVIYKALILVVTAVTLYLVVMRRYKIMLLAVVSCILVIGGGALLPHSSVLGVVLNLTILAAASAAFSLIIFFTDKPPDPSTNPSHKQV